MKRSNEKWSKIWVEKMNLWTRVIVLILMEFLVQDHYRWHSYRDEKNGWEDKGKRREEKRREEKNGSEEDIIVKEGDEEEKQC
jgi:hypothetical protein